MNRLGGFVKKFAFGRPPLFTGIAAALALPQMVFYTAAGLFFMVGVWGFNVGGTFALLPFMIPGIMSASMIAFFALYNRDMPPWYFSLVALLLTFVSFITTVPCFIMVWAGMTRLNIFLDTAIIELQYDESQIPYILFFILFVFKMIIFDALTFLFWGGAGIFSAVRDFGPISLFKSH